MKEIRKSTICELLKRIRLKDVTINEIVNQYYEEIRKHEHLNAFLTVCSPDEVIKNLKGFEHNSENKNASLFGLPIAIKDNISTQGIYTTCASRFLENYIPTFNATSVNKVLEKGAFIIGKTNLDEFAMGSSGENSAYGICRNPWNRECVAGGSSSGSAVAVAAGLAPCALGSDTGGSVRQPAAFCGVTGIKPTYGRISRYGLVAYASSLDQIGIFCLNVSDLPLLLSSLSGWDCNDATSYESNENDFLVPKELSLKKLKIGVPGEYFTSGLQEDIRLAIKKALEVFQAEGAEIIELSLPHTEAAVATYYVIASAEAASNLSRYDGIRYGKRAADVNNLNDLYVKSRTEGFGSEVKRRILLGNFVLSSGYYNKYYLKAQKVRRLITNDFLAAFSKCDLLLTPTTPTTAFKIGEIKTPSEMFLQDIYTLPASLAGLPAMSIPCGFDKENKPIGMQLIGNYWQENKLIFVGREYQKLTNWHKTFCF